MRVNLLDGIRGHLLIMMMLAHLSWQPEMGFLGVVHHARIIGLFDAEFLIFMSGMLVGFLFVTRFGDATRQARFLRQRLVKIYRYYVISAVPFLVFTALVVVPQLGPGATLKPLAQVLIMQNGGSYSDILPIYIYCFLLLFAAVPLIARFGPWSVLLPFFLIYVASHFSFSAGFFGLSGLFMSFDVSAWQFLFFIAFVAGAEYRRIGGWIAALSGPVFAAALVAALLLTLAQRGWNHYPMLVADPGGLPGNWARMQLHPYHLLRILLVCGLFALILMRDHALTRLPQRVLDWYFNLAVMRLTGKYSIQLFVFHVILMAVYIYVTPGWPLAEKTALALVCMVLFLIGPFVWDRLQQRRPAPTPRPAPVNQS